MPERDEHMPGLVPERDGYIPGVPCAAFNGRGCAATPVLANPRRSGGDAWTLAR
jgi:hypothetical protein